MHRLIVVDVETGAELEIAPDDAEHGFDGWAWSPDGRSVLVDPRPGYRLVVVDVATGRRTELPWARQVGSPSWQRLAGG